MTLVADVYVELGGNPNRREHIGELRISNTTPGHRRATYDVRWNGDLVDRVRHYRAWGALYLVRLALGAAIRWGAQPASVHKASTSSDETGGAR